MQTLTTYLCNKEMLATGHTFLSPDVISVSSGLVSTKLIQEEASCIPNGIVLNNKIIKNSGNKYCNLFGTGSISWVESRTVDGLIEITYSHPSHCHWIETVLWVNGHNRTYAPMSSPFNLIQLTFPVQLGEIPDSKSDVSRGGYNSCFYVSNYWGAAGDVVPGDRLNVMWYFSDGDEIESVFAALDYFSTPTLTGGLITAVNGDYGSEDITYTVYAEDEVLDCVSSDFVEYAVDDWVIVQKSGNVILPMKIGDFTN